MIGHVMNGFSVVAVAPSMTPDLHVLLAARPEPHAEWVVATINSHMVPQSPESWNSGTYYEDEHRAIEHYASELSTDPSVLMREVWDVWCEAERRRGAVTVTEETATCRHCSRRIVNNPDDGWIDPEASGDDRVWRETCDALEDTFVAHHEPDQKEAQR